MGGIEFLIVFPVAALYFPVVPGGIGFDQFVPDTKSVQLGLKGRRSIGALWQQPLCKLGSIVGLYALNGVREALHNMLEEQFG